MENRIEKAGTFVNVNADVAAHQSANNKKAEFITNNQRNVYGLDLKGELVDPEVTGIDTLEVEFNGPMGIGIKIKATSQVTSSVKAQEELNEDARKNLTAIAEFFGKAAMAIAPAFEQVKNVAREQDAKDHDARIEWRRKEQEINFEIENARRKHQHEADMADKANNHELRMLDKKLDDEYDSLF